jgi:hypothetical protein
MKTELHSLLSLLGLFASLDQAVAQGTSFNYQGRLQVGSQPANGLYDFTIQVFDDMSAGNSQGSTVNTNGVGVTNGHFMLHSIVAISSAAPRAGWK